MRAARRRILNWERRSCRVLPEPSGSARERTEHIARTRKQESHGDTKARIKILRFSVSLESLRLTLPFVSVALFLCVEPLPPSVSVNGDAEGTELPAPA